MVVLEMKPDKVSIYVQAVVAMLFIQLIHKIVREIPGALKLGGYGAVATSVFAVSLVFAIVLTLSGKKAGLFIGVINGIWMLFQPILVHVIMAHPDQNGIWWYPVFPWTQAVLIIYFCVMAWRHDTVFG